MQQNLENRSLGRMSALANQVQRSHLSQGDGWSLGPFRTKGQSWERLFLLTTWSQT